MLLGRCTNNLPARSKKGKNFENQSKIRTSGVTNKEYRAFHAFGTVSKYRAYRAYFSFPNRAYFAFPDRAFYRSCRALICIVPIVPFVSAKM